MSRETSSKPRSKASPGVKPASHGSTPSVGGAESPIDSDGSEREPAAKTHSIPEDGDDDVYGDPSKVQDQGILESLGEAVSSPVRNGTEKALSKRESRKKC